MTESERIKQLGRAATTVTEWLIGNFRDGVDRTDMIRRELDETGKFERGYLAGDGSLELRITLTRMSEGN